MTNPKPNIILVNLDGSRFDRLGISPEFQALCKEGTLLDNISATAPYTVAAMNSIFTGLYGKENGINAYYKMFNLRDSVEFLPEVLQKNGYFTVCDLFHDKVVNKRGFNVHHTHDEYNDDLQLTHPQLIEKTFKDANGKPIFCFLQYSKIHMVTVSERLKKYSWDDKQFYKNKEKNLESYDNTFLDACKYARKIKDSIESLGKINETIIIFFTDHGTGIGERFGERNYGSYTFEETIRTYYLFIGPRIQKNKTNSTLFSSIDIFPTILEFCQILLDKKIQGQSFAAFLEGKTKQVNARENTFTETGALQGPHPSPKEPNVFCIKSSKFKLIFSKSTNEWQLFDLINDPKETENLYGRNLEIETDLKQKLVNWINR